jgi:hypothetical protein
MNVSRTGPGLGDQFFFACDVFDHARGTKLGHTAGQCTETFLLDGGQITTRGLADTGAVFVRGEPVRLGIEGAPEFIAMSRATALSKCPLTCPMKPPRTSLSM